MSEVDRIEMSQRERDILKVMGPVLTKDRTQEEAGRLLDYGVRQIRRIQRKLEKEGDRGIIHGLRGQPSNHRIDSELRRHDRNVSREDGQVGGGGTELNFHERLPCAAEESSQLLYRPTLALRKPVQRAGEIKRVSCYAMGECFKWLHTASVRGQCVCPSCL